MLTLNSPPVDLTSGVEWVAFTGDAVDLQVLDPVIGPVGHYNLFMNVDSELEGNGPSFISIDTVITGLNAASDVAFTEITAVSDLGVGTAAGGGPVAFGDWVLASAAVPEPSSLALAGTRGFGRSCTLVAPSPRPLKRLRYQNRPLDLLASG